ncbi:RHS repeat domain-containing protein [Leptospira brenneri]|uniref:RHS repeat domain-containing protein n=1 Tax=Leptospira brenneri TaxID=2023182 RepID=UPI0026D98227
MYFFHPDHLGSIIMITDGNGNVLAGGERGGKSHITYKPYGEILRTDSYGPDITKFKYTGQEEDQESGLYYYKARYYDAGLGRFASNDGMVFPDKGQGMNRMMYVEGNPIAFVDPSGNNAIVHMFNQFFRHAFFGAAKIATQQLRSLGRGLDYSGRNAGRGIDGGARWLASGGNYSRNKGNDLDNLVGTKNFFASIQKSDVSNWLTKQYKDMKNKPGVRTEEKQISRDKRALEWEYIGYMGYCHMAFGQSGLWADRPGLNTCLTMVHSNYSVKLDNIYQSYAVLSGVMGIIQNTSGREPNCGNYETGISTPDCPANDPTRNIK